MKNQKFLLYRHVKVQIQIMDTNHKCQILLMFSQVNKQQKVTTNKRTVKMVQFLVKYVNH